MPVSVNGDCFWQAVESLSQYSHVELVENMVCQYTIGPSSVMHRHILTPSFCFDILKVPVYLEVARFPLSWFVFFWSILVNCDHCHWLTPRRRLQIGPFSALNAVEIIWFVKQKSIERSRPGGGRQQYERMALLLLYTGTLRIHTDTCHHAAHGHAHVLSSYNVRESGFFRVGNFTHKKKACVVFVCIFNIRIVSVNAVNVTALVVCKKGPYLTYVKEIKNKVRILCLPGQQVKCPL